MIKKFAISLLGLVLTASVVSCNSSDSSSGNEEITYSSTLVKAFSIKKNNKILTGLDSVFFSIDLVKGEIFNADSLPYGTKVSKLLINLSTDACSKVELNVPRPNDTDTVINYLTNSTDSINFSNGPVRLHLVSYDGKAERDYMIKVNVHKTQPDLLYWNELAQRRLPSNLTAPKQQKSVKAGDTAVCLTSDGADCCIAITTDPAGDSWSLMNPDFGFTPAVGSLTAAGSDLYILADDGSLYKSTDLGATWSSTGQTWEHIYGAYEGKLLGCKKVSDKYRHVSFPASTEADVKSDCPVAATGSLATIQTKWSATPQVVFVGGRLADGSLSRSVWGYDGASWAQLSKNLPEKIADVALLTYMVAQTDSTTWRVKSVPALLAIGGVTAEGASSKVMISRDLGVNWKEGDELLQIPDYIAPRMDAQPLVFESTLSRSSGSAWTYYHPKSLPTWYSLFRSESRATAPITEWECPYIYLFGGYDNDGTLYDSIWKGVINRLTFKPLQ